MIATSIPTATHAPTVRAAPTHTAVPTATQLPATATVPASIVIPTTLSATDIVVALTRDYRIIPTHDGFVTVRAKPSSKSDAVTRLKPGTVVSCTGFVKGEALFGTDQWAECPSVGGYILSVLLVDAKVPTPAPPVASNEKDAVIKAVHRHVDSPDFPFRTAGMTYRVDDACIDENFAIAVITRTDIMADGLAALLKKTSGRWNVIFSGPGIELYAPNGSAEYGFPENFKCLER